MREKLVECYGRKQMLRRNYASRDNHLRQHCVCWGVNSGRELVRELNKCIDLHRSPFQTLVYDLCTRLQTHSYIYTHIQTCSGLNFYISEALFQLFSSYSHYIRKSQLEAQGSSCGFAQHCEDENNIQGQKYSYKH